MVFRRNAAFFVAVALATTSASAMELVGSEVPAACQQICMPVVLLSGACATAERKVLGNSSPPAAVPPSSPPPSSSPPSSAPTSSAPPSSPPPPPPPESSRSSSSTPSVPPPPPVTTSPPPPPPSPPVSSPSAPPPTTPPPATTQPPANPPAAPAPPASVPPPAQLTPSPENPPPETTPPPPPPQLTPTEPATTSEPSKRGRKGKGERSSSSSRELKFGPAAESFLAALSSANADRRKGKQRDVDGADNDPSQPTAAPGSESARKREVSGRDSAVGRRQAPSAEKSVEHDQFQRACYCRNLSFDVSGISGLCGSCIAQNSNTEQERKGLADANSILAKCEFPTATYKPDAAKQAAGITLVAVMPSRMPPNDPGGMVFIPGMMPKGGGAATGPVPATDSGSGDGQGAVQRGGVGEMAISGSLAVLTAVCWALLALVAV
ncbi:hypothetical protein PspLS_10656 [Pyricularia sp. CBS 133598]|nr:hypothetical protein PspLS_10656 [Pyricularia sp. CBS 133598]